MSDYRRDELQTAARAMGPDASTRRWRILFAGTGSLLDFLSFGHPANASDQHVLSEIVGESTVGENVFALRDELTGRSNEDRFETLTNWVLPDEGHLHFRIQGSFTATNPAASVASGDAQSNEQLAFAVGREMSRVQVGGNIAAPAFDLVSVAKTLDRLDELRRQVETIETPDESDRRAQLSLLEQHRLQESDEAAANNMATPPALKNWAPVSRLTASSRGRGLAHSYWNWDGDQVSKVSGHDQDYQMFRSPLQGNFEVECEVSSTDWQKWNC